MPTVRRASTQQMVSQSPRSTARCSLLQARRRSSDIRDRLTISGQTSGSCLRELSTVAGKEIAPGEDIYRQALSLTKEADDLDKKKEEKRSNMMYEAYQRSKEKELNPKSQGVTVVKTLVKQVRKERTKEDDSIQKREKALELLKRAATEHNHPDASIQLGNMLLKDASRTLKNTGTKNDGPDPKELVHKAMELFRQAGESGSRVGFYNLGHLLWTGFPAYEEIEDDSIELGQAIKADRIVSPDMTEAMVAFHRAIDLGDSDAMYLVGVHMLGEANVESNREGFELIKQAAENGHEGALYYLALLVSTFSLERREYTLHIAICVD